MPMQENLFTPLATPEEITHWDELARRDYHVPTLLLMENAARAALEYLKDTHELSAATRVLIFAGGGNNGGDGLALARQLLNQGCQVEVRTLKSPASYRGISRKHLDMARRAGVSIKKLVKANDLSNAWGEPDILPDIIIDALVGAGFNGPLRENALVAVRRINQFAACGAFVLALDIPSGLCALSGRPQPEAVRANATICFAAAKPGLCLPWAKPYTGQLRVAEIGLPLKMMQQEPSRFRLLAPKPGLLPKFSPQAHKADKGRVLIIGGSPGLTGAATLAALGACRAGAGLVTVAAPASLAAELKNGYPEIMTLPLGSAGQTEWDAATLAPLFDFIAGMRKKSALVLGPGLGRTEAAAAMVEQVLRLPSRPPLVLDADALFHLRLRLPDDTFPQQADSSEPASTGDSKIKPNIATLLRPGDVLTPHAGEMLRLFGLAPFGEDGAHQQAHPVFDKLSDNTNAQLRSSFGKLLELPERSEAVKIFCAHCPAVLLLKGAGTLIGRGNEALTIAPFAEPNLAVGGSGDVLSGLIAALLARELDSLSAACLGAWVHARAGAALRRRWPAGGNLASDIALLLPEALAELY